MSDRSISRRTTSEACSLMRFMAPAPVWLTEMAKPAIANCFVKYTISVGCLSTRRTVFGVSNTTFILTVQQQTCLYLGSSKASSSLLRLLTLQDNRWCKMAIVVQEYVPRDLSLKGSVKTVHL